MVLNSCNEQQRLWTQQEDSAGHSRGRGKDSSCDGKHIRLCHPAALALVLDLRRSSHPIFFSPRFPHWHSWKNSQQEWEYWPHSSAASPWAPLVEYRAQHWTPSPKQVPRPCNLPLSSIISGPADRSLFLFIPEHNLVAFNQHPFFLIFHLNNFHLSLDTCGPSLPLDVNFYLLHYSWFTIACSFQGHSFRFFFMTGYYKMSGIVPCAVVVAYLFCA